MAEVHVIGKTNLVGAMARVTSEVMLRAVSLVRLGKLFPLAQIFEEGMPQMADSAEMSFAKRFKMKTLVFDHPQHCTQIFSNVVEFPTHTGTHIDAFAHWSKNGQMYGGLDARAIYSEDGMRKFGLEQVPPIITRGVLIDAASLNGKEVLPGGTVLQPEDLRRTLDCQRVELRPGDVVLVRTGWARHWKEPKIYRAEAPGLSRRSATWIADQDVVAIGIDQWLADAVPPERPEDRRACHEVCLVERGLHIIENLNLELLADEQIYEFLFIALAPPVKGATGFPIQAVAVL